LRAQQAPIGKTPVTLTGNNTIAGLDDRNIQILIKALRYVSGQVVSRVGDLVYFVHGHRIPLRSALPTKSFGRCDMVINCAQLGLTEAFAGFATLTTASAFGATGINVTLTSTVGAEIGRHAATVLRLEITRKQVSARFRGCVAHSDHAWGGDALERRLWSMVDAAAIRFDTALASRLGG
jgi:hypothetical protein